jgi:hypothetical protein
MLEKVDIFLLSSQLFRYYYKYKNLDSKFEFIKRRNIMYNFISKRDVPDWEPTEEEFEASQKPNKK